MKTRPLAAAAIVVLILVLGAGVLFAVRAQEPPTRVFHAPSPAPTTSAPSISKPPSIQAPLPLPTYVRWAVDKSSDAGRPYLLVLIYDGVATNFRIVDVAGQVVLRVPIAGSGVFGSETCAVKARPAGKTEGFTFISIDASALQQFVTNAASYKAEADTVGATVTVPLSDSGCRAS